MDGPVVIFVSLEFPRLEVVVMFVKLVTLEVVSVVEEIEGTFRVEFV